jgi:lysophospholipase L1-like esterase
MADLISLKQLADASTDAQTLADTINGNEQLDVISRLGAKYPTLAKAIKLIMSKAPINATPFANKAALLADTTLADGAFAFVYNDSVTKNNGVYQKISGVWTFLKSNDKVDLIFDSQTVNKLDPQSVINGIEIYGDGSLVSRPDSVTSGLVDVENKQNVTISGLQDNTSIARYYRFLDSQLNVLQVSNFSGNEKTLSVPSNAVWFQIALKQRNSASLDISKAQIELSNTKSTFVNFVRSNIVGIDSIKIKQSRLGLAPASKNLFDKTKINNGYEVYGDGSLSVYPNAVASDYIDVTGLSKLTISGLQSNTEFNRYYAFYDSNKTSVLNRQFSGNTVSFTIPSNAKYFRFSLLQRTATTFDGGNTVQVESGSTATSYEAYKQGVSAINGIEIVKSLPTTPSNISRAYGAKYLFFGDSITETSNVEQGIFTDTSYRSNYPKFAKDMLKMSDFKNYARSGASFMEYNGQLTWQKISHQIDTAITNAENPDIIVLACGTNDSNINLGDYTTAMSKDIGALDRTNTAESMRWALYQIRQKFPSATCFYCTQLQRADVETTDRETANNLMVKLAKRYGFNVIDTMYNSGIVRDFELWQANGRYLSDGLHPNVAGQQVQANYIVSQIIERMTY